jgi:transcriptional regulator of NAD metabolism
MYFSATDKNITEKILEKVSEKKKKLTSFLTKFSHCELLKS